MNHHHLPEHPHDPCHLTGIGKGCELGIGGAGRVRNGNGGRWEMRAEEGAADVQWRLVVASEAGSGIGG